MPESSHQQLFVDFKISTHVGARYDEETKQWVSVCPVLDLYSQGDTEEQAIFNIHEAVSLFLGTCYEIGTSCTAISVQPISLGIDTWPS